MRIFKLLFIYHIYFSLKYVIIKSFTYPFSIVGNAISIMGILMFFNFISISYFFTCDFSKSIENGVVFLVVFILSSFTFNKSEEQIIQTIEALDSFTLKKVKKIFLLYIIVSFISIILFFRVL